MGKKSPPTAVCAPAPAFRVKLLGVFELEGAGAIGIGAALFGLLLIMGFFAWSGHHISSLDPGAGVTRAMASLPSQVARAR